MAQPVARGTPPHSLVSAASGSIVWQAADSGLPEATFVHGLAWDSATKKLFANARDGSVYVSNDRGVTWSVQQLPKSAESQAGRDLPFAAADGTLYFGTTRGLYAVTLPSPSRRRAVR